MGIEKSALKVTVAESFTDDIKARQDKSRQNIYRYQGAHKAFQESEELLKKATKKIRDDFVGGKIEIDTSDPMNIGKFLINSIMMVSKKLHDLSNASFDSIVRSEGEVRGMELAVEGIDNVIKSERLKIAEIAKSIESGQLKVDEGESNRPEPRAVGTHPGPPMKAKRLRKKAEPKKRVRKAAPVKKKNATDT